MKTGDYRTLFIFLGGMIALFGAFVFWSEFAHPTSAATDNDPLRVALAAPKTDLPSQLVYEKDHESEWADAHSGDRTKALPAWGKILNRFRFNVVASGEEQAKEGLKNSEAWWGTITGDTDLDKRLIEAAVLSRLYREGDAWEAVRTQLDNAASNQALAKTLADYKY